MDPEKQRWRAWYRCRLCGLKFGTITHVQAWGLLDAAAAGEARVMVHPCSGKGKGIADLIGVMHDGETPGGEP